MPQGGRCKVREGDLTGTEHTESVEWIEVVVA
jgi:hypothetical protein